MPEKKTTKAQAEKLKFVREMQRTRAVDFDQIGELVKQLPETVLGAEGVAADHVIKVYESVLHVSEIGAEQLRVEEVDSLRDIATRFDRPGR
ncbi:hypothetical protein CFK39_14860 [Brachybacterium avium]|uniref:Uncharacterized protein n=1 Tax=Brachybacterium avium TaxID=2017485 RepID=A0A220UG52_9MICO|nr:hypothetical protein [Brachybacterium avium]ASK66876.1 hypothetical protein CFK39_14860 [Brachybacterium avium]